MTWLKQIASLDAKEVIKLLLLFGTVFAGCQVNRQEIREVAADQDSTVVLVDESIAAIYDSLGAHNLRIAAVEKHRSSRRVAIRRASPPKPGLVRRIWHFFGG